MKEMISHLKEVGSSENIAFEFSDRGEVGNSLLPHSLIMWSKQFGKQAALVDTLFRYYFEKELNVCDIPTLVSAAVEVGLDESQTVVFFETNELLTKVSSEFQGYVSMGITYQQCPFFILKNHSAQTFSVAGAQSPEMFKVLFQKLGLPSKP